jgi:hypothetical protein
MKIASEGGTDPMVTTEQVQTMFSNTVTILEIHRNLFEKLKEAMLHWYPLYNMATLYIELVRLYFLISVLVFLFYFILFYSISFYCFLYLTSFFEKQFKADKLYIYSEYINGYDKAMQTLQNLQSTKNAFKEFVEVGINHLTKTT